MTKKEYIVEQLRDLFKQVRLNDQCLYDIVEKDVRKSEHHVELVISHRNEIIARMLYNKLTKVVNIESCGRTNGNIWSTTEEFKYEDIATDKDKAYIKELIFKITLEAVEVIMANRNQIELGTIDM